MKKHTRAIKNVRRAIRYKKEIEKIRDWVSQSDFQNDRKTLLTIQKCLNRLFQLYISRENLDWNLLTEEEYQTLKGRLLEREANIKKADS